MGQLTGIPEPYNPNFPFNLNPDTIQFVEFGYPMCEGSIKAVGECIMNSCNAHLIGFPWCPVKSHLTREITPA